MQLKKANSDNDLSTVIRCLHRKDLTDPKILKEITPYITHDSPGVRTSAIYTFSRRADTPVPAEVFAYLDANHHYCLVTNADLAVLI